MPTNNSEAAIAFYGVTHSAEAVEAFYRSVVEWFQCLGYPPEKAAISAPGHSGKYVSFARADAKLTKNGFAGVTTMEISALIPDAQFLASDYFLTAQYSREYSFMYVSSLEFVAPLSRSVMLPLALKIVECARPEYGIGYMRDHSLGPSLYAVGICQGEGLSYEEGLRISRWCDASDAHVWREGLLRDIYCWNFLTAPQLAKLVHGMQLKQWVAEGSERGTLTPLSNGVCLWEVPEENISSVRLKLDQAGCIFDWNKHIHLIS